MSVWIDKKYLNLLAPQLEMFKWVKKDVANHRCPICGDSKKKKTKRRGYHFVRKGGLFYKCHNCGAGMSTGSLIKYVDPRLHNEYVMERYKNGENKFSNYEKPDTTMAPPLFTKIKPRKNVLDGVLDSVSVLDNGHPAKEYVKSRQIPEKWWSELYFIDDVRKIKQIPAKTRDKITKAEPRLLIPFHNRKGRLIGLTGRSLDPEAELRYMNIVLSRDKDEPLIFNLDRANFSEKVYVVEGPIDSMFLPNAVAVGGTNLKLVELFLPKQNSVLIFDYQPRNKELLRIVKKTIERGFFVCLLPEDFPGKDINEAVLNGMKPGDIQRVIDDNTYQGLEALAMFAQWKRA